MTSSKPTKVGSFHSQEKEKKMAQNNCTTLTVAPRKPLNLNCSLVEKSLRRCFKHLPYLLWNYGKRFPHLWAKGYYCRSAGHVSQEAVKRYINEQEGKDVFEYSFFGSPNQKIGNFTGQQKLEGWSA